MIDLKDDVVTAIQTASGLSAVTTYFFHPPDFNTLPCISYFEVDNTGGLYADDREIGSEVVFQIDIWGRENLTTYANRVNSAMATAGFSRMMAVDLFEKDARIHHKSMRFRIDVSDPSF